MNFKDLKIKEWMRKTLESVGITTLTEIQKAALPSALKGDNVLGCLKSKRNDWEWKDTYLSAAYT